MLLKRWSLGALRSVAASTAQSRFCLGAGIKSSVLEECAGRPGGLSIELLRRTGAGVGVYALGGTLDGIYWRRREFTQRR